MAFVTYDPATDTPTQLVSAIFTGSAGVVVQPGSVSAQYGAPDGEPSTISFYDGSLTPLGIGAGLLLTTGDPTPPTTNTSSGYSVVAGTGAVATDNDLQNTVNQAFPEAFGGAPPLFDVTYLQFQVNVTDPNAKGIRLDVVFGSEEYPEWSSSNYVDVAGVYVNGVNYALFNGSASQPLSVAEVNLDPTHVAGSGGLDGFFRDNNFGNTVGTLPIEYDGVSVKLQVTAPVQLGLNTIKIAIADVGDSLYDSGLFVSGMQAVNYAGYGLSEQVAVSGTPTVNDSASNQTYLGDAANNTVQFGENSGQDVFDGGAGVADQATFSYGLAGITGFSWDGQVLTLHHNASATTLVNVEHVLLGDGTFAALDTSLSGTTFGVYAMLWAAFQHAPGVELLSQWVARADSLGGDLGALGDEIINTYAHGLSNSVVLSYLYTSIAGVAPSPDTLAGLTNLVNGQTTVGDLFAVGALLPLNTNEIAGIVGSIQLLDHSYFA